MFWFYEYLWSLVQLVTHYNVVTVQNWKIKKKTLIAILHASCSFLIYYWVNDIDISATLSILCSLRSHRSIQMSFKIFLQQICLFHLKWLESSIKPNRFKTKETAIQLFDSIRSTRQQTLQRKQYKKIFKRMEQKELSGMNILTPFLSFVYIFIHFFHGICQNYKKVFIFFRFYIKKITLKKISDIIKTVFLSFRSW